MYLSSAVSESGIEAHVVLASSYEGVNIWTIETKAPKFIDAEFCKHRMLSSNSSSSRAIPFSRSVDNATFMPLDIRAAGKGMQNEDAVSEEDKERFLYDMAMLRDEAVRLLTPYAAIIHKQHINRYLEPWSWQKKIVTGTEWDNFFSLRLAKDAQPEMRELALCIKQAMEQVIPKELVPGEWHLPYVLEELDIDTALCCSVARCARVSYMNHDNKKPTIKEDAVLYEVLASSRHMTPFEHQAKPMEFQAWGAGITHKDIDDNFLSGNFRGFIQHRQLIDKWNPFSYT